MSRHKQLAVLFLMSCSMSASAIPTDSLFWSWGDAYMSDPSVSPVPPPSEITGVVGDGNYYIVDRTNPVDLTFVFSSAGYDLVISVASLDNDGNIISPWETAFVKTGNSINTTNYYLNQTSFSYIPATGATEIFFKLDVVTTGDIFYSGPASNNVDNTEHAASFYAYSNGMTLVGFEDLAFGGDLNYDDIVFMVSNVQSMPLAVPEPETWVMLLAGLGIVGAVTRRHRPGGVGR